MYPSYFRVEKDGILVRVYFYWKNDYSQLVRIVIPEDDCNDLKPTYSLASRIRKYAKAKYHHMEQLDNECIGLAMLVKEGCISSDVAQYTKEHFVYRSVSVPKKVLEQNREEQSDVKLFFWICFLLFWFISIIILWINATFTKLRQDNDFNHKCDAHSGLPGPPGPPGLCLENEKCGL
jgi:hypothetical protein